MLFGVGLHVGLYDGDMFCVVLGIFLEFEIVFHLLFLMVNFLIKQGYSPIGFGEISGRRGYVHKPRVTHVWDAIYAVLICRYTAFPICHHNIGYALAFASDRSIQLVWIRHMVFVQRFFQLFPPIIEDDVHDVEYHDSVRLFEVHADSFLKLQGVFTVVFYIQASIEWLGTLQQLPCIFATAFHAEVFA